MKKFSLFLLSFFLIIFCCSCKSSEPSTVENSSDGEEVVNKSIDFSVCDIITKTDTFLFNTDNVKDLNNISSLFSEIKKNLV